MHQTSENVNEKIKVITNKILFVFIPLGPPIGSYLYEHGGFTLPFTLCGTIAFLCAIGLLFSAPDQSFYDDNNSLLRDDKILTFKILLKVYLDKRKPFHLMRVNWLQSSIFSKINIFASESVNMDSLHRYIYSLSGKWLYGINACILHEEQIQFIPNGNWHDIVYHRINVYDFLALIWNCKCSINHMKENHQQVVLVLYL